VLARWSRVSNALADLDLHGYRVALVTGTQPTDLAGSLTYYFNARQRVARITFEGTTGDARPLVHYLATTYHFQRDPTAGPGLYRYRAAASGERASELRIRPAAIQRAREPLTRFAVSLVIERPAEME